MTTREESGSPAPQARWSVVPPLIAIDRDGAHPTSRKAMLASPPGLPAPRAFAPCRCQASAGEAEGGGEATKAAQRRAAAKAAGKAAAKVAATLCQGAMLASPPGAMGAGSGSGAATRTRQRLRHRQQPLMGSDRQRSRWDAGPRPMQAARWADGGWAGSVGLQGRCGAWADGRWGGSGDGYGRARATWSMRGQWGHVCDDEPMCDGRRANHRVGSKPMGAAGRLARRAHAWAARPRGQL